MCAVATDKFDLIGKRLGTQINETFSVCSLDLFLCKTV